MRKKQKQYQHLKKKEIPNNIKVFGHYTPNTLKKQHQQYQDVFGH